MNERASPAKCLVCDPACAEESQIMPVWLRKIVLAQHNSRVRFQWLVKARSNSCATAEKSGINVISLLLSVSDWLIIMIGPSGLLLLVPHLFALPVSILYITKL